VLQSIGVTPLSATIFVGQIQQFTATGYYSDGSQQNLTGTVTWNSTNTAVANFVGPGLGPGVVTGLKAGTTMIKATQGGITGGVMLNVTDVALQSIAVTPFRPSIALGTQLPFLAIGTYSDGSTHDISSSVTWASSAPAIATITGAGLARSLAIGQTNISATYGTVGPGQTGVGGSTMLTVTPAEVAAISVWPPSASIPVGTTEQFHATGTFTDGTMQDLTSSASWTSTPPIVPTINAGLVRTSFPGTTTITATVGSIQGSAILNITPAALVSIAVTPPSSSVAIGNSQQFTATGTFNNGSTQDLTSQVNWSSADTTIASIDSMGLALTAAAGTTQVTATSGSVTGSATLTVTATTLVTVTVTPAIPSVPLGETQQFTATGTFADGSIQDITQTATWSSTNPAVATISMTTGSVGLATALTQGTTTIIATQGPLSGNTTLTVNPAALLSISLSPSPLTLPNGTAQQLVATGKYSDGTTQTLLAGVTWTSSDAAIAPVSTSGLVTAVAAAGSATVTAQDGNVTGSLVVQVSSAVLVSIAISPSTPSIPLGTTQQFTATGTYTDNSTQNLTSSVQWMSSNAPVATISVSSPTAGLAQSLTTGSTTITAMSGSVSATATLTVTPAALVSISIAPSAPSIDLGRSQQFTATGTYTDGSSMDLTSTVTWTASPATVAVISNQTGSQGLATSSGVGSATITGTLGAVTSSTALTVGQATIVSIAVTPATSMISVGLTQQFTAIATYTDGTTNDVTASVTWSSSPSAVAAMTNNAAMGVAPGTAAITASSGGVQGTASLTVFALPLISSFAPSATTITSGSATTLTAYFANGVGLINPGAIAVSSGVLVSLNPAATTTYTLTVTNDAGTFVTAQLTVTVVPPPVITSFIAGAAQIAVGASTTLTAVFSNGTGSINPGALPVSSGVPVNVTPMATTTYTLTVVNSAGTSTTATAGVVVTTVTLVSITVTPANSAMLIGRTLQLYAAGNYSDGSHHDLTGIAAWSSSVPTTAAIGTSPTGTAGLASAAGLGTTIITATYGGMTGSAVLGVTGDGAVHRGDDMVDARDPFTATVLPNGSVLVLGGFGSLGIAQNTWDLYDPTGTHLGNGLMLGARANHTATLLNNGTVLIAGGVDDSGAAIATAELYHPATGTFTQTGPLRLPRYLHTATLLQDGTVLMVGGEQDGVTELYDPVSAQFSDSCSLTYPRDSHTATLLSDGRVLIAGGEQPPSTGFPLRPADPSNPNSVDKTVEIYDPVQHQCLDSASAVLRGLTYGRYGHTATTLNDGTVLLAGGIDETGNAAGTAELYYPGSGFGLINNLNPARAYHTATLLGNGMVLLAGGLASSQTPTDSLLLYDPVLGIFSPALDVNSTPALLTQARYSLTATLLTNGSVLFNGGKACSDSSCSQFVAVATTDKYTPAILAPPLTSIIINPLTPPGRVFQGNTLRFHASDQDGQPLLSVAWSIYDSTTNNPSMFASITNDSTNSGTAQFNGPGSVFVKACLGSQCGQSSTFIVEPPAPVSITLTPQNPVISLGVPENFGALVTFTDGSTTQTANWASSNSNVATFNDPMVGSATLTGFGQSTITASFTESFADSSPSITVSEHTTLTVTSLKPTAFMKVGRDDTQGVVLGSGQVLITGGASNLDTLATERSAELYDLASGFAFTGNMTSYRRLHTATVLTDGSVLIAGGRNEYGLAGQCGPTQACIFLNSAEIYDPASNGFTGTGGMTTSSRAGHTATRLNDGTVLVTGGSNVDSSGVEYALNTAEIYSPINHAFGAFASTNNYMSTARYAHTATLLNNGKVLIAGGIDNQPSTRFLNDAELYDPLTRTFTPITTGMHFARARHAATLLPNGTVLLSGGIVVRSDGTIDPTTAGTAEIYDPVTNSFGSLISFPTGIELAGLPNWSTLLTNGTVLLTDGNSTVLYDPGTQQFTLSGVLITPRNLYSANLLDDGEVLFAGGVTNNFLLLTSAELYPGSSVVSNSPHPPNLTDITVTALPPVNSPLPQGATQQFIATGKFVDPTTGQISYQELASVTWTSGDSTRVTITKDSTNSGMAYAVPQQGGLISPTNVLIKACAGTGSYQLCNSATLRVE
jgi:hypothetical protein